MRRSLFVLCAFAAASSPDRSYACPFCAKLAKTQSDYLAEADLVVYGTPQGGSSKDEATRSVEFRVETIVKEPAAAVGRTIHLTRPLSGDLDARRLIFARIEKGGFRPFRVQVVESPTLVEYLRETVRLQRGSRTERLRFYFGRLDDKAPAIADDAYKAYSKFYAAELAEGARAFDSIKLRKWILDDRTPSQRVGLYGLLLGMAGDPNDGRFLARLAEAPPPHLKDAVDGLLGGLAVLDQTQGVDLALKILTDPRKDAVSHRGALAALQFILAELPRTDSQPIFRAMTPALDFPDVADLIVDELRKGRCFNAVPTILTHASSANAPGVRGAAVRFALACPTADAAQFLKNLRASNPQSVIDAEQSLRFERDIAPAPPRIAARR